MWFLSKFEKSVLKMWLPLRFLSILLWFAVLWISLSCEGLSVEWDQQVLEWRTRVGQDFSPENLQSRELLRVDFWLNKSMQATQVEDKLFFCGSDSDNQDVVFLGCNNQVIPEIFELQSEFNIVSSKINGFFSVETIRNRREEFLPLIQAQTYLRLFLNHFFLSKLNQENLNAKAQTTLERLKRAQSEPKNYQAKLVNKIVGLMKEEVHDYKNFSKLIVQRLFVSYKGLLLFPMCLAEHMTHNGFFIIHEYLPTNPHYKDIRQIFNTCKNLCERDAHVAVKAIDHPENAAITLSSGHLKDYETVFRIMTKKRAVATFNLEQARQFMGCIPEINKKMTVILQPTPQKAVALASIDDIMKTLEPDKRQSASKSEKKTRIRNDKNKDIGAEFKKPQDLVPDSGNKKGPDFFEAEQDQLEGSSPPEFSLPDESSSTREEEISALQLKIEEQLVLIGSQDDQLVTLQEANSTLSIALQERDAAIAELLQQLNSSDKTKAGLREKLKGVTADKKEANRKCFESQTQLKKRDQELKEAKSAREKDALQIKSLKQDKGKLELSLKQKQAIIEQEQKSQIYEAKRAADLQLEIDYWKRVWEQSEISYQQSRISNLTLLEELIALRQELQALKLTKNRNAAVLRKE